MQWRNSRQVRAFVCALVFAALASARADLSKLRLLEKRTAERPRDFIAFTLLGQEHMHAARESGDLTGYAKAEAALQKALDEYEGHAPALIGLGGVRLAQHRFAEAAQIARNLLASRPDNQDAHLLLFDALFAIGQIDAAEKELAQVEESAAVFLRRSDLARIRGANDDARKLAVRAADEAEARGDSPMNIAIYRIRLGELYFRGGDFDSAAAQYHLAEVAWPESYSVGEHIAELRGAQENFGEAAALYKKLLERSHRPDLAQALGDLYALEHSNNEAKPCYEQALAGYRASIDRGELLFIHHLAGYYCDVQQDGAEAVKWARKDLELRQTPAAHEALAWALYRAGDFEASRHEIDTALSSGMRDAHLLSHASFIYSAAGDVAKGESFRRAAEGVNRRYNSFHIHR